MKKIVVFLVLIVLLTISLNASAKISCDDLARELRLFGYSEKEVRDAVARARAIGECEDDGGGGGSGTYEGCFIATAVYGTPAANEIDILRSFRDRILLNTYIGKQLVSLYYNSSPPIANELSNNELMRDSTRILLVHPLVLLTEGLMNTIGLLFIFSFVGICFPIFRKLQILKSILKGTGYALISFFLMISMVLMMGLATNIWEGFPKIAIYVLPLIIPTSIVIFILSIISNFKAKRKKDGIALT